MDSTNEDFNKKNDANSSNENNGEKLQQDKKINDLKNSNTTKDEEDMKSKILNKYKKFQQEVGCTDEELLDLVLDIETMEIKEEEIPSNNLEKPDYGSQEYWEKRYQDSQEPFEWYFGWQKIEDEIKSFFEGKELALNIGCGNSEMSEDMFKSGIQTVVSIDISQIVIDQMSEKYKNNKNLLFFKMDCTDMEFKDDLFDIVIDKGTFDAILCGNDQAQKICDSIDEIWRILKNGGIFIEITHAEPKKRIDLFKSTGENWKFYETKKICNNENQKNKNFIYIYVLQKNKNDVDDE